MAKKITIEPMGKPELMALLKITEGALMAFWQDNFQEIGKRYGHKFSTRQVEIFYNHFGESYDIEIK